MRVSVKLIASYRKLLPAGTQGNTVEIDIPRGTTVAGVLTRFDVPLDESSVVLVNGLGVDMNTPLTEGDKLAAFSAVAGG